jgi:hypothetical protein
MSEPTRIFLSAVSSEFGTYREKLAPLLRRRQCFVRVQEDFRHEGSRILDKLERYISESDCAICLLGKTYGAEPVPPTSPRRSFTQWEYHFAWAQNRKRGIPVYLFEASGDCPRDTKFSQGEEEATLQRDFLKEVVHHDLERQPFRTSEELVEAVLCLKLPREERGRFESLPLHLLALLDQLSAATIDLSRKDLPQKHSILQALLDTYRHLGELERASRVALDWFRKWHGRGGDVTRTILQRKIDDIGSTLRAFGESLDRANSLLEIYDLPLSCRLEEVTDMKKLNLQQLSLLDWVLPRVAVDNERVHLSFATNLPSIGATKVYDTRSDQGALQAKQAVRAEVIAQSRFRKIDVNDTGELEALLSSQDRIIEQIEHSKLKLAEFIRMNIPIERMLY